MPLPPWKKKSDGADPEAGPDPKSGLEITCFGSFSLRLGGRPLPLNNRKARELLALLACERGAALSKRRVCSLLWDSEPELAMDSLSKVCRAIRAFSHEHGDCIPLVLTYSDLSLDLSHVRCDLTEFDLLYERADAESCRKAAALRTGALLFDNYFTWAQDYEGRYEIKYLELCEKLALYYQSQGKPRLAACYEKMLEL